MYRIGGVSFRPLPRLTLGPSLRCSSSGVSAADVGFAGAASGGVCTTSVGFVFALAFHVAFDVGGSPASATTDAVAFAPAFDLGGGAEASETTTGVAFALAFDLGGGATSTSTTTGVAFALALACDFAFGGGPASSVAAAFAFLARGGASSVRFAADAFRLGGNGGTSMTEPKLICTTSSFSTKSEVIALRAHAPARSKKPKGQRI